MQAIDSLIAESDKASLYHYFELLTSIKPDGIYFADLGVIPVAETFGLNDRLVYDPVTMITNCVDAAFYIKQNIGVVLNRELTYEEYETILNRFPGKCDMQIFGHLRMSLSKRRFLSNYFKEIGNDINLTDRSDISLVEESRNYHLPVRETRYGTEIYSDNVLCFYPELVKIREKINHCIVDSDFVEDELVLRVLKELKTLNEENAQELIDELKKDYEYIDSAFLYKKVMTTKEENDD